MTLALTQTPYNYHLNLAQPMNASKDAHYPCDPRLKVNLGFASRLQADLS